MGCRARSVAVDHDHCLTTKFKCAAAAAAKSLQSCLTLCDPIDGSPPGSAHPRDSPGKNTGVGCHFFLQCMKVKRESEVAQSYPTLMGITKNRSLNDLIKNQ